MSEPTRVSLARLADEEAWENAAADGTAALVEGVRLHDGVEHELFEWLPVSVSILSD